MKLRASMWIALVSACGRGAAPASPPPPPQQGNTAYQGPAPAIDARRSGKDVAPDPATLDLREDANDKFAKGDYEAALDLANRALEREPADVRMLRIVVSAACTLGEPAQAKKAFDLLPAHDQEQMTHRCARYGITLP